LIAPSVFSNLYLLSCPDFAKNQSNNVIKSGRWVSPGTPVSSTNKTNHHNIAEKLLEVALNTIKQTNNQVIIGID
jgi:hypothetical protein